MLNGTELQRVIENSVEQYFYFVQEPAASLMKHWVSDFLIVFSVPGFLSGLPEVLWVVL